MKCYGSYSIRKKLCASCDLAEWCKDAADTKLSTCGLFEDWRSPDVIKEQSESLDAAKTLAELLSLIVNAEHQKRMSHLLMEILSLNAVRFQIITKRLISPQANWCDIAREVGCSRQLVSYHVGEMRKEHPLIMQVLPGFDDDTATEQTTLGERIRIRRKSRNLTQRELANKAGISIRSLQRLERGDSENNKLAAALIHVLAQKKKSV